jgi:hypothetical protein
MEEVRWVWGGALLKGSISAIRSAIKKLPAIENKFALGDRIARRAKADLGLLVSGLEGDALVAMNLLQGGGGRARG